jgi:hypothetical protein
MTTPLPLYALELEGVARDVTDPQGLVLSVATDPVAIAAPVPRSAIQHLVQALDDFLYDSRPA